MKHILGLNLLLMCHMNANQSKLLQDSGETMPEVEEASDSDLDEEAALRFYKNVEERLKLKRKGNKPGAEE